MKAERRHELKTNVLLARLSAAWGWADAHKGVLFVGALILIGVCSILYLWARRSVTRPQEAWVLLGSGGREEDYRRLVDDYGSTRAAQEGRLLWASLLYERMLYTQAQEQLDRVLADADGRAYDGARALLGLATVAEQQHQVGRAIQFYKRIVADYPAPAYVGLAQERIRALESPHRLVAPPEAFAPLVTSQPSTGSTTVTVPIEPEEE